MAAVVEVNRDLLRLVADFLTDYSEQLSNDSCNDWEVPKWLDRELLSSIAPPNIDDEQLERIQIAKYLQNDQVTEWLSEWIRKELKTGK